MDYCISPEMPNATQQCSNCTLINGKLYTNDGYPLPNCLNTQWVQIQSWPGTNNTPVYQVVPLPLDSWMLVVVMVIVGSLMILKNRFI